ncbi:hypothetical protein SO802_030188 [Lithocarpus litseifolius]|uniref:RNase H type-1 domain-containing protein n=1 Tax=Lithocarpus litseifolius TaxID=425828 RepID=A0AAW2BVG9_9ROSI
MSWAAMHVGNGKKLIKLHSISKCPGLLDPNRLKKQFDTRNKFEHCFKTNYDGAMFDESDEVGLGVVVRNSEGQVLVALSEKIKKPPLVVALELLAARRAAVLVSETGFQQSCFEGDSEVVVKSLRGSGLEKSAVGHILKDTVYC